MRALRTQTPGSAPCAARHALYLPRPKELRPRQEMHRVQQYARRRGGGGGSAACDLTAGACHLSVVACSMRDHGWTPLTIGRHPNVTRSVKKILHLCSP